ncbi:MAG: hypothetical protein M1828_000702 [Chrysothrix sp. TS-e1954]|nr:MAG: hypothetical protein M1828_000702 [Chrysothrix sp. TS-e1954]
MPIGIQRLNAGNSHPNDRVIFIKPLPGPDEKTALDFLNRIAAICAPIMRTSHLSVMSLEEFEPNREFVGRNFNAGEVIQLVLKAPGTNRWLPFRYVQMVMMHELAHCNQMNHSRAFWAVRNKYAEELRGLWDKSYTGDGFWGRGQRLYDGQYSMDAMPASDYMPENLCGGTYRSSRGRKRKRGDSEQTKLSYAERKQRRLAKKFGKDWETAGRVLGEDEVLRYGLEKGKRVQGNPRVAKSKRGRELRAAAALARFDKANYDKQREEALDRSDQDDLSGSSDDSDTEPVDIKQEAVDSDGSRLLDAKGRGMVKICGDEDSAGQEAQQEMRELGTIGGYLTKSTPKINKEPQDEQASTTEEEDEAEGFPIRSLTEPSNKLHGSKSKRRVQPTASSLHPGPQNGDSTTEDEDEEVGKKVSAHSTAKAAPSEIGKGLTLPSPPKSPHRSSRTLKLRPPPKPSAIPDTEQPIESTHPSSESFSGRSSMAQSNIVSVSQDLPGEHRALRLHSLDTDLAVEKIATPQPINGSVVVRVLSAPVISYMGDVYSGKRRYPFPMPLTVGTNAIARVAAVGKDATRLKPGQLVHVDCFIKSRDNPSEAFLHGLYQGDTEGSMRLMRDAWRDSTYAEYCNVPLENCELLDEECLVQGKTKRKLQYSFDDLCCFPTLLVPYGGLRDINLQSGETVVISPATGQFGGAAVIVALAMGARVIAMGRNPDRLKQLAAMSDQVDVVPISNDVEKDLSALRAFGTIDAFFDISPTVAAKSSHIKSAIKSLRKGGRVSLMGGFFEDIEIPFRHVMHQDITIKGKWMYNRSDIVGMIKLVETGNLRLGEKSGFRICGKFALEDWKKAFESAASHAGPGELTIFNP